MDNEGRIRRIFGKDADMAIAIAKAESGLNCKAQSKTNDYGIFQINQVHEWRGNRYDCLENIKIAYQIFKEQKNWSAWSVYNNGKYKKYKRL